MFSSPLNNIWIDNSSNLTFNGKCEPGDIIVQSGTTSSSGETPSIARHWPSCFPYVGNGDKSYSLLSEKGRILFFDSSSGKIVGKADVNDIVTTRIGASGGSEWVLQRSNGDTEIYNSAGQLQSKTALGGTNKITYIYSTTATLASVAPSPGFLIQMTDQSGRQLNFTYDAIGHMVLMTDPMGGTYRYSYDVNSPGDLISVTYPDGKVRQYLYNEAANINNGVPCEGASNNLPRRLTGITDENNVRFAIFKYQCNGLAISTEHQANVDKYSFSYLDYLVEMNTTVTDPLGTTRSYKYSNVLGVNRLTGITQPKLGTADIVNKTVERDANGNVTSLTDFNGNVTTYTYDLTRNLETKRTESSDTAQARTISTAWHATYRLPVKLAEPKRITTFTYDDLGNLLTRTMQATTDATGTKGLSPSVTGVPQVSSYTYNSAGQILTSTDSLQHTTTYTYYPSTDTALPPNHYVGDLATVTNAAGQVTSFTQYDANGRLLAMTDANGATTALTYSPRGWLTGKTVTSGGTVETTTYGYDGVGQLTLVTLPNASTVSYTYDPAHRLTNIADSLGNSIAYTLDNMGNRISEQVKDPSGALARQTSRVVDALNRIQQITGAVQ